MLDRYEETREWRKRQLARSLEALIGAIQTQLPDWSWQEPAGGPHLWLQIPETDANAFSHLALRYGLALVSGSLLAVDDDTARDHVRVPLYRSPESLVAAVDVMATVWRDLSG